MGKLMMSDRLNELLNKGYTIFDPIDEICLIQKKAILDLNEIGKFYIPDFDLSSSASIVSANQKGYYKAIKNHDVLMKIYCSDYFQFIMKQLNLDICSWGPSYLRIDVKEEGAHKFGLHQDAASLLGSKKMFTYWIPFFEVNEFLGSLAIYPGSHKNGLLKSNARNSDKVDSSVSHNLELSDDHRESLGKPIILNCKPGAIVVMDPLLVHESYYPAFIHSPRLTAIIRVDLLSDREHLKLGFKSAINGDNIYTAPEYHSYYD